MKLNFEVWKHIYPILPIQFKLLEEKSNMGKGWCVDGQLDTTLYNSPIPLIGLYIVVATLVCFFCMAFDLVCGFSKKKTQPYLPCKLFRMNAFTLTVLAVATKIPNDLITQMPRVEDQLSKLTSTALLCTALVFYMPSLGTMGTSERYGNLTALSVTVITTVVNVCIQIHTGVIFAFTIEHIIIIVCILLLLLIMWSSAIALRDQIDHKRFVARKFMHDIKDKVEDLKGLRDLVGRAHAFNYKFNPQTMLCRTPNHHTFGFLCVISLLVVSQSMVRYCFIPKSIETCSAGSGIVSDYKWSIPVVIWTQFPTILVGSTSIICRWFSLRHRSMIEVGCPQMELENLRLKTSPSFWFPNKKLSTAIVSAIVSPIVCPTVSAIVSLIVSLIVFAIVSPIVSAIDIFKDYVLIPTQIVLYKCNILFFIHCFTDERSGVKNDDPTDQTYKDELERYRESCKEDIPTNLLDLVSTCPHAGNSSDSECASFMGKLQATGKEMIKENAIYEYRVSCISVLVLSGILEELMPSHPRKTVVMESLKESFEIISFVDEKIRPPIWDNERRWMSTKEVWEHWENPTHWFRTKIIKKFFNLKQVNDLGVLRHTLDDAIETHFKDNKDMLGKIIYGDSLTERHIALVSIEFAVICKFMREQSVSAENLLQFLETCFAKMLCFTLSGFPLAILKEMDGDPDEIDEGRIRKALKYCYKLEPLSDKMDWSWQAKSGHSDVSFAAATPARAPHEEV